jgi:hypothetical protein
MNRKLDGKETYRVRLHIEMGLFRDIQYVAWQRNMSIVALVSEWCQEGITRYRQSLVKRLPASK